MARIDDGFPTFFDFGGSSTTFVPGGVTGGTSPLMWEKTVTPPGIQAGGETDTTTMRNTTWRTRSPKKLKTLSNMSGSCAYDTKVYDPTEGMLKYIGINQQIQATFPDGSQYLFWGWLDEFTPDSISEGEQPTASFTIIASNHNGTTKVTGVETPPKYTAPTTTGSELYAAYKAHADEVESRYTKPETEAETLPAKVEDF
jgi:hypothetical protein